jgi:hypothetical protein
MGRSTGKRDMKGREICEGDIVKSKYGNEGVIECRDGIFYIAWKRRTAPYIMDGYESILEVIGHGADNK